ncbi:MAG TPA: Gfo/Idh/MocA family oxidoreductase, partial [Thermodesulfobacteriota bacterium]|nr:Gfo/Idh/MocA family oxidoreductase [Thermodesulfobacteriota bacterium]
IGKPVQVAALMGNQLHKVEIEDVFCSNIIFENGAFASVQATINQPRGYSVRQVAGDKGIIVMPDVYSLTFDHKDRILLGKYESALSAMVTELKDYHYQPRTKWESVKLIGDPPKWKKLMERMGLIKIKRPHGLSLLMDSFVDSILNGTEPLVSGESTLPSLELINAILLSATRKRTVDLPIDRGECEQLFEELISGKTLLPTSR